MAFSGLNFDEFLMGHYGFPSFSDEIGLAQEVDSKHWRFGFEVCTDGSENSREGAKTLVF